MRPTAWRPLDWIPLDWGTRVRVTAPDPVSVAGEKAQL